MKDFVVGFEVNDIVEEPNETIVMGFDSMDAYLAYLDKQEENAERLITSCLDTVIFDSPDGAINYCIKECEKANVQPWSYEDMRNYIRNYYHI